MNRVHAPAGLQRLIAFVNSEDIARSTDELADLRAADVFLKRAGFYAGPLTGAGLERLQSVRTALTNILAPVDDERQPIEGWQRLSNLSRGVCLGLNVQASGPIELVVVGSDAADAVIASLMLTLYDASRDGTWVRVKGCRSVTCRWAFFDSSKNGSGAWCSMAVCGNREKARRRRQKVASGAA